PHLRNRATPSSTALIHPNVHTAYRRHCVDTLLLLCFFFNHPATTEIYTLSLHDALPISDARGRGGPGGRVQDRGLGECRAARARSEEHTSELQSLAYLVCRLLLEKKNCWTCLTYLCVG